MHTHGKLLQFYCTLRAVILKRIHEMRLENLMKRWKGRELTAVVGCHCLYMKVNKSRNVWIHPCVQCDLIALDHISHWILHFSRLLYPWDQSLEFWTNFCRTSIMLMQGSMQFHIPWNI